MPDPKAQATFLTTSQAANILRCTPANVQRLARVGSLPVAAVAGNGQRLFDETQVRNFAKQRTTRDVGDAA
jgi:excisionase family DNA binding protein